MKRTSTIRIAGWMRWAALSATLFGLLPSGCEADILRIATPFLL